MCCFFNFSLAGSGRAHPRTSPFRAAKKTVFFEVRRRDLSNTHVFGNKIGPPGKPVLYSCLCHPDDHALSTFGAGGFYDAKVNVVR